MAPGLSELFSLGLVAYTCQENKSLPVSQIEVVLDEHLTPRLGHVREHACVSRG